MPNKKNRKTIFLDRDGVIIKDTAYVSSYAQVQWLDQVPESLALLKKAGYLLIVVTNQSGVARGYFNTKTVEDIHQKMNDYLNSFKAGIDAFYYCPHLPGDHLDSKIIKNNPYIQNCSCRKPKSGLIDQALTDFSIDLEKSYLIGDQERDIQAGNLKNIKGIGITEKSSNTIFSKIPIYKVVNNFKEACSHILSQENI